MPKIQQEIWSRDWGELVPRLPFLPPFCYAPHSHPLGFLVAPPSSCLEFPQTDIHSPNSRAALGGAESRGNEEKLSRSSEPAWPAWWGKAPELRDPELCGVQLSLDSRQQGVDSVNCTSSNFLICLVNILVPQCQVHYIRIFC